NIGLRLAGTGALTLNTAVNAGAGTVGLESAGTIQQPATTTVTAAAMEVTSVGSASLAGTNKVPLLSGQVTGAGNSFLFRDDATSLTVGSVGPVLEQGTAAATAQMHRPDRAD